MLGEVLVRGLRVLERIVPMPDRLGAALPVSLGAGAAQDPVILVGGFANGPSGFEQWRRSLLADGFQVFVFDLPSRGLGDMRASAELLAAFIAEVKRRTGRTRVDLIGYSEGGLLARMAVASHGAEASVDRIISLATPHAGIPTSDAFDALAALGPIKPGSAVAAAQLVEGSALLAEVERADALLRGATDPLAVLRGARYVSLYSRVADPIVTPRVSWLAGALNVPIRHDHIDAAGGPNHWGMFHSSDRAYDAARAALLDLPARVALEFGFGPLVDASASGAASAHG